MSPCLVLAECRAEVGCHLAGAFGLNGGLEGPSGFCCEIIDCLKRSK